MNRLTDVLRREKNAQSIRLSAATRRVVVRVVTRGVGFARLARRCVSSVAAVRVKRRKHACVAPSFDRCFSLLFLFFFFFLSFFLPERRNDTKGHGTRLEELSPRLVVVRLACAK